MRYVIAALVLVVAAAVALAEDLVPTALDEYGGKYATDRFVITLKPGVQLLATGNFVDGRVYTGNFAIDQLCAKTGVTAVAPFYDHPVKNDYLRSLVERLYIFYLEPEVDARQVYRNFLACNDVEASDLYVIPELCYTPNDPQFHQQWALAKVNATYAWNVVRGDSTRRAIIAIDDTGVYWSHPDIRANLWINGPEDLNHNGILDPGDINYYDDDGNSYLDDVLGWDFGMNDNDPAENTPTHGTHVAGCASEVTDNGIGGAGLGYSARIMCIKVTNAAGQITQGYQGMIYAADNGAHIINLSWGSPSYSSYGQSVCNYTYGMGVLNVAAAGNDDYWTPPYYNYPSAYNNVFAVASTDPDDRKSSFSNYGAWVDVSAPGSGIYSTWGQSSYSTESGTSMASPIVAGLAALLKAQNPSWTAQQIATRIQESAVDIDSLNPNYQGLIGTGRIDAYAALASSRYPNIQYVNHSVALTYDDGDGVVNPGESIAITVTLVNIWQEGHDVQAILRAPAGITVTDSTYTFGTFPGQGQQQNNASDPFDVTFSPDILPGRYSVTLILTSSDPYYNELTFDVSVTLEKAGFPLSFPDVIESSPVIFDINGDGTKELLIAANNNSLYAIKPDAQNLSGWPVTTSDAVIGGAAVGDIDGDLAFEVVACSRDGNIYAWRPNGTLVDGFPVVSGGAIAGVPVLGDLDRNGDLEIVALNRTTKSIIVLNHDGTPFGDWPYVGSGSQAWNTSAALGDIDGDSLLEIVICGLDSRVYAFNGDKTAVPGWPVVLNGRILGAPAIGNVIGADVDPEIVVATYQGSVYVLNHDGSIAPGWPVSLGSNISGSPSLSDLDDDGFPEIMVGAWNANFYVLRANGSIVNGFPITTCAPIKNAAVSGDIDGNGQPDIVVATGSASVFIYAMNSQGQFLRNFPMPAASVGEVVSTPAIWDFDGDGDMEIAVGVKGLGFNLDVIDCKRPTLMTSNEWPFFGKDIYRSANYAGLFVSVNDQAPAAPLVFSLSQNYPNPFNSATVISYTLAQEERVLLSIYDLLGRRVRVLDEGLRPAGVHLAIWDGRDDQGSPVAAGLYFYRLEAGLSKSVKKMVLLK